jgi:hypothetical protein
MLKKVIMVAHKFFSLLELYTQGRSLTVTTNRQLKNRVKKPPQLKGYEEKGTLSQ